MPEPQAVLAPLTRAALVLVVTVDPGEDNAARVRSFAADLPGLVRSVGFRDLEAGLSCVLGFGAAVWPRLFDSAPPAELHPFRELAGDRHRAPATPGDMVLHIRSGRPDLCFELASQVLTALGGAVTPVDEVQGFRFFDFRDLLGFVDGTEHPTGRAAVQRYQHDLVAWNALSVEEQQRAIGRDKLSNVELPDEDTPASAHRVLTSITDDSGRELAIVRDNMPFGSPAAGEFGTYFIGYAKTPAVAVLERMLRNMVIGDPPGTYDRILDFSTAVTGCLFFVPAASLLEELADGAE
jgi:putative iron-dependent peroxidase